MVREPGNTGVIFKERSEEPLISKPIRKDGQKHVCLVLRYCSASQRFGVMRRHDPGLGYPVQKLVQQYARPCAVTHFRATRQTNKQNIT